MALGGYARRELCPASDVDVLLLHDGWGRTDLEELVGHLCYPLWDAGLSVGHAVRTPKDAVRAAGERIDTATALTDRRLVAGDRGLLDELSARTGRWLQRSAGALLAALATADADRHRAAGDLPGMLEPDLKSGAGGLRDIHSLRWAAACVLGEVGLDPLVGARYLGADDRSDLARASETLLAARCALHLVTGPRSGAGGSVDRLRLDLQDEVAERLGDADGDVLLRRVGLATRSVAHLHGRAWPLLLADARGGRRRRRPAPQQLAEGVMLVDGLVETDASRSLRGDPALGLRAVAAGAARSTTLGRRSARRLREDVAAYHPLPWTEESRGALLTLLDAGAVAVPAIADADHVGLVEAHLPEWWRIRGRPQRNPLHRFDLDTHGLQAVVQLRAIADGALAEKHAAISAGLPDRTALLLGTWLHDVGKAWDGDHSEVGAQVAVRWVTTMGFGDDDARRVATLVRHHLLLPDVATGRDLDDPREIERVAETLGDVRTLDELYLLSLADSRATGPAAWSAWKDSLLARLHRDVRGLLGGDIEAPPRDTAAAVAALRELLADDGDVDGGGAARAALLLDGAPPRYLEIAGPEQAAEHARLLQPLPTTGEIRASLRPGPSPDTLVLTVVAGDRLGLVADVAGVLAGHGLEVLDARAFTRVGGIALDVFVVSADGDSPPDGMLADLEAAGAGRLDVAGLVRRRERRRDARPPALAQPIGVDVSVERTDDLVRVEVAAPDSPGLLWRLTSALAAAGLDLVGARLSTLGPQARDAFEIRPWSGAPTEEDLTAALRAAVPRPPT